MSRGDGGSVMNAVPEAPLKRVSYAEALVASDGDPSGALAA
jgi:hypothetical protein